MCHCALPRADTAGVNDRVQLAAVEAEMQRRLRQKAMLNGATLVDPSRSICQQTQSSAATW